MTTLPRFLKSKTTKSNERTAPSHTISDSISSFNFHLCCTSMGPRYLCSAAAVDLEYGYPPSPIFSARHYLREHVPFLRQGRQTPQRLRHQDSPPPIPAYSLFHLGLAAQPENISRA